MPETSKPRAAVALVIGVGAYKQADRIAPLRYATRDAKALARLLIDPEICGFPPEQVTVLTQKHARRDKVVHSLSKWLPEQAQGADLALLYFAGHGMVQKVGLREEGFLLPYDADPEDVITRGIAMSDVGRWIDGIGAQAVVVCLDCCHAGKVMLRETTTPRDLELRPSLIQTIAGKGRFLIASCDAGQKSLEAEELGHGLFTYHLIQGIQGAGDRDGDGKVGIAELFTYVSAAVAKDAQEKFGREQRPWSSSTWADDVTIAYPSKRRTKVADPAPPINVDPDDSESWLEVTDETRLLEWLRRLRAKPDGANLPAVFHCLAHPAETVRRHAKRVIHVLGWEKTATAIEILAPRAAPEEMAAVLDGLAAFESHTEVVHLLDRLVALLKGDIRNRTILLLERKRQGLELDKVAALFREIQSPYRIEKALGQGLLTSGYLARIEGSGLEVVVRVLRPEFASQPHMRAQFIDLAHQSVRFVHHNLVLTREARAFPDRHVYYAVSDYVNGVTLQKLLESGKRFLPEQILEIIRQLLAALTPLHENGLPHGGIKPSNIFLREGNRVILGDPSLTAQGIGLTLARLSYDYRYAAPEHFRSGAIVGPPADFYGLGCVAYELACGQPPFVSDNYLELAAHHGREPILAPSKRGSDLGRVGDEYVLRLLATNPAERFVTVQEAQAALNAIGAMEQAPEQASAEFELSLDEKREKAPVEGAARQAADTELEVAVGQSGPPASSIGKPDTEPEFFPGGRAWLLVVKGENAGQRLELVGPRFILGRSPDCQLVIPHVDVSRKHAQIVPREGKYYLDDFNSRNRTYVNDIQVTPGTPLELRHGDRIAIGDFVCTFLDESAVPFAAADIAPPPVHGLPESSMESTQPGATVHPSKEFVPLLREESLVHYQGGQSILSFSHTIDPTSGASAGFAPMESSAAAAPKKIGRYELQELIGRGGMGEVWKARDSELGRQVALKMLHLEMYGIMDRLDSDRTHRFDKEIQVLAKLQHPNIVPIYDTGSFEGMRFFAMPLIAGGSLKEYLTRQTFDLRSRVALLEKVARAVQYAHEQQIIHRDLKPGNILLDEHGEPLVSDFGLAKFQAEAEVATTQTRLGRLVGTPAYMAPDQFQGWAGPATDIYALGAILYEMLTGRPPFAGKQVLEIMKHFAEGPPAPRSVRPEVDGQLENICLKCLQMEPAARYSSAGELADDLARWLRGEPIKAAPVPPGHERPQWLAKKASAEPSRPAKRSGWWKRLLGQ
jgi:serine/threonine protein kinase